MFLARNTSVALSDHFTSFIESQIVTGRYGSASDVVRAGLRLLEAQEIRLEKLRRALIEGEESGEPTPFDMEAWLTEQRDIDSAGA